MRTKACAQTVQNDVARIRSTRARAQTYARTWSSPHCQAAFGSNARFNEQGFAKSIFLIYISSPSIRITRAKPYDMRTQVRAQILQYDVARRILCPQEYATNNAI